MSTERAWYTRRYQPGDERDLVALFNSEFGLHRSVEHWQWQFGENPFCEPIIVVARRRRDDLLVGSHTLMPVPLNIQGREALAGHTLDLVVHHDYRRQGIFETTARECFEWALTLGVRAVFAFPNSSSYPGFVRSLGWARITYPRVHSLRLGCRRSGSPASALDLPIRTARRLQFSSLAGWPGRSRGPSVEFSLESRVPAGHDDLWAACAPQEVLSLYKDARYFGWRYDRRPDVEFEYALLGGADGIAGLAVLHRKQGVTTICELIIRDRNVPIGRRLVEEIVRLALSRGDDKVTFFGHDQGFYSDCLVHFTEWIAHENAVCGASLGDPLLAEILPLRANWSLTYGDADFV